jgi:hypothetical protein
MKLLDAFREKEKNAVIRKVVIKSGGGNFPTGKTERKKNSIPTCARRQILINHFHPELHG